MRNSWKIFWAAWVGTFGVVGGIIGLFPDLLDYRVALSVAFLAAPLLFWCYELSEECKRQFEAEIAPGTSALGRRHLRNKVIRVEEANVDDLKDIAAQEAEVYSKEDAIPYDVLFDWYSKNPCGFLKILKEDQLIGHLNMLPVKETVVAALRSGQMRERELRAVNLWSPEEKRHVRTIYVESIAMPEASQQLRPLALVAVLESFVKHVKCLACPTKLETVIAMAATKEGGALLEKLDFTVCGSVGPADSKHRIYEAPYRRAAVCIRQFLGPPAPGESSGFAPRRRLRRPRIVPPITS
jgi:hypothetical protein